MDEGRASLGLALSSGAALGAAHGGVLLALERAGICVDVVAGCSAGAIIGGAWAAGSPAEEIIGLLRGARFSDFATPSPSRRLGVFDTRPMVEHLVGRFGDVLIEDLPLRFGAVLTELGSLTPRLASTGPLVDAMVASSAVPVLFPPVPLGEHRYVDGGVLTPQPVWAARELGADVVLVVELGRTRAWRRWQQSRLGLPTGSRAAEVVVEIDTRGAAKWSAADSSRLIDAGYRATMQAIADHPEVFGAVRADRIA